MVMFSGSLTFTPDGPKEQTVSATIQDDSIALEDDEEVIVTLNIDTPTTGLTLSSIPSTTVTILDNDGK